MVKGREGGSSRLRYKPLNYKIMSKRKVICPFCGEDIIEYLGTEMYGEPQFKCKVCGSYFYEEDIIREELRHRIAHVLIDTDEDNQINCDIVIGESEAVGLSTLELPRITKAYQIPGDGTIWFQIQGFDNGDDGYINFDELETEDLRVIAKKI